MKKLVLPGSFIFLFLTSFLIPQAASAQTDSAMSLTTTSQYAHLGNVITTNNDVTMEAWVYWSGSTAANQLIFYNGNTGNAGYGLMVSYPDGDKLAILCGGVIFQSTGRSLYQNAWNHVALTKKGNEFILYLNGTQEYSGILFSYAPSGDFMIGGNPAGSESFKGYIDEVRVWNSVRTPIELFKNAGAALSGTETGLVALYNFDEGSDTASIVDATVNHFDLSTNGNPAFVGSTAASKLLRQQVSVVYSGGTSATVKWLADPHNDVTNYVIYRDLSPNNISTAVGSTTLGRLDTTFTDTGLDPNTVYYYSVRAGTPADSSDYYRPASVSTYPDAGNAGNFAYGPYYEVSNNQNIPTGNSPYTLEAWIRPTSMGDYGIVGWGDYGIYNSVNALRLHSNGIHHYWWNNDLSIETGDISGSWHHVAVTYDGTTRKMYFDGILRASDNPGSHTVPFTANLTIGKTYASEYFYGDMDELRIWNVARTEAEITAAASMPLTGQETGLVSLYHFDESDGQFLVDQAGGNHGMAVNGAIGRTASGALRIFPPYSVFAVPGDQQVEFTWTNSASPNILKYELYFAIGKNGEPTFLDTAAVGETSRVITSVDGGTTPLTNGQVYLFAVRAVDINGRISDFGNHLEAIPTVGAGNAMALDGYYQYVNVNHNPEFNFADSITISAWIKTMDGSERYITTKSEDSWYLAINGGNSGNDGKVSFWLNGPSNSPGWTHSATRVDDGLWHHVAATYDGYSLKIYVDGHLSTDVPAVGTIYTGSNYVQIAARNGGNTFNGEIDELSFWKKTLSEPEIRSHIFSPIRGDENGLIALYHFNEPDADNYLSDGVHGIHNGTFQISESSINMVPSGAMVPPFPPAGLYATADTGRVKLHWQANFESGFQRYRIFVSDTSDFSNIIKRDSTLAGNVNDTTKTISGLTNFKTYYFRITAVLNDGTESVFSSTIEATPTFFQNVPFTFPDLEDKNLAWGDYDDDGDYDLLVVGGNSHYGGGFATIYKNTSGTFTEQSLGFEATAWGTSASWCDYNNDGRLDVSYMGATGSGNRIFKLYENNGNGTFTDVPTAIQGISKGWMSWADFDNDGDQDVVLMGDVGDASGTRVYRNDGNGNFTLIDAGLANLQRGSMAWADYDKDGDMDLLMAGTTDGGNYGRSVYLYRNDGNGGTSWSDVTVSAFDLPVETSPEGVVAGACSFGDLNNDGYPDIIYTGGTGGARIFKIYLNDGDGTFTDQFNSLVGVTKGITSLGDFDNDGDLDILVSGENTTGLYQGYLDYITYIAENDGNGNFTMLNSGTDQIGGYYRVNASGGWNDYDRDGDLDIVVGGQNRNAQNVIRLYKNISSGTKNTAPSDPSFAGMTSAVSLDTVRLSWTPSTDAQTPSAGLTYNIRVGSASAGVDVMSPMAKVTGGALGGGFRYVFENGNTSQSTSWMLQGLADGTYFWSVEAIDQIYRNSKFQAEKSFTIDGVPSAPVGLVASSAVSAVNLQWSPFNKSDVSKYFIYASGIDDVYTLVDSSIVTNKLVTKANDTTAIQNGNIYYFKITAMDQNGYMSPFSEIVSAIPSLTPGKWFVNHTGDDGQGYTLREVIDSTNLSTQPDTIVFKLPIGSVIQLNSGLPPLSTGHTVIDGDSNADGVPDIQVLHGWYDDAFTISSSNNIIKGLVIGSNYGTSGGGNAIVISGADAHDNYVLGNYIGTDFYGMTQQTTGTKGIVISNAAHDNWIGNGTSAGRNVISGHSSSGIQIDGSSASCDNNNILGNMIGLTVDGSGTLPNQNGIYLYYKSRNTKIGNGTAGGRNVISGNSNFGIYLDDNYGSGHIEGTQILGNYIGTDPTGMIAMGNASNGIYLFGPGGGGASVIKTEIGDGTTGGLNVISGNGSHGIYFYGILVHDNTIDMNYIGVTADGSDTLANNGHGIYIYESWKNTISNNVVSGNNGNGIQIESYWEQANDNVVKGNKIGTNAAGTAAIGNSGNGIHLQSSYSTTDNTIIGGTAAGEGNLISGNTGSGIALGEIANGQINHTQILGNYIGTNSAGTSRIANTWHGIYIYNFNDQYTSIGNGTAAGRNIISGNGQSGIWLEGTVYNTVLGNYIGVDATGNSALPNDSCGIVIWNSSLNRIGNGTIGGRNIVSANGMEGIEIYAGISSAASDNYIGGNYVGVGANGSTALGNAGHGVEFEALDIFDEVAFDTVTANIIAHNGEDGIHMESMANPGGGGQVLGGGEQLISGKGRISYSGANNNPLLGNRIFLNTGKGIALENYANSGVLPPAISDVSNFTVSGTGIIGAAVEVYQDTDDEGQYLLGATTVDGSGNWSISHNVFPGLHITAIQDSAGNTSEFSAPMTVVSGTLVADFASLNFGNILYGSTDSLTVKVWTVGNPLYVSGASIVTANFTFTGSSLPDTLFLNDTMQFKVKFHPTTFGSFADTLLFQSSGGDMKIALSGTGLPGTLATTAANYDFGNIYLGDSASFSLKVFTSTGSVDISALTSNGGAFSGAAVPAPPGVIDPGDTTVVTVKFKPTALGTSRDTLRFINNSTVSPFEIVLSGGAIPGVLGTTAPAIAFGNIQVGDSATQKVKLYARFGDVSLSSASLPIPQLALSVNPSLPAVLHKNDTAEFTITYKPDAFVPLVDTLRVFNSSLVSPFSIPVSGNGAGGNLGVSLSALDFGTVIIGDSITQQVKVFSTFGLVAVNNAFLSSGTHYSINTVPALPQTIQSGDTIVALVKFKPSNAAVLSDTLNIGNNSSVNPLQVTLSGTGKANTPPRPFSVKALAGNLTNDLTPVISWEGRGDADGDAVTYALEVSKNANMSSPQVTQGSITDTVFTIGTNLDQVALYYYRVTATDTRGGSTQSNVGYFRTDGQAPVAVIGALTLDVVPVKDYLQVYAAVNEKLKTDTVRFVMNSVVDNSHTLVALGNNVYYTEYRLNASGTLEIRVTGTDSAGNYLSQTQSYAIAGVSKEAALSIEASGVEISGAKGSVKGDGYILVSREDGDQDQEQRAELGKALRGEQVTLNKGEASWATRDNAWAQVGTGIEIISTVKLAKTITVKVRYTEEDLGEVTMRYPEMDERKVGIYREESGNWVYEGGEGGGHAVTAKMSKTGRIALFYNPEHEFLPRSIELAQNYPNPFNPTTTIRFGLPEEGKVKLVVYNVLGQKVKELLNESRGAGYHTVMWNGRNETGEQVSSGLYIYRIETAKGVQAKKMLLVK